MAAEPAWGSLPFPQAIAFFRAKKLVPTEQWSDLTGEMHDTGFMIAGVAKMDLLADMHRAIDKAIADGIPFQEWKQNFGAMLDKHGWEPAQGRDWRARVIFMTNVRTAYAAGRYRQMRAAARDGRLPYWIYRHSDTSRVPRPLHVAWNGLVLPADHPWFKTHYPPNGWGCQCRVFAITRQELARMGRDGPDEPPDDGAREWKNPATGKTVMVPNGIDPGWDYCPGASLLSDAMQQVVEQKLATLPPALARVVEQEVKPRRRLSLDSALKIGAKIRDELAAQVDFRKAASQERWNSLLLERLQQRVAVGRTALIAANRGEFDAVVNQAANLLPASWIEAVNTRGPVDVARIDSDRAYYFGGKLYLYDPQDLGTVIHEFAHHVQRTLPYLDSIFQAYHRRRTKGEKLTALMALSPGYGYRPDEMAKPDKYLSPYFGKEYTGHGALEMLPMTLALVLGHDRLAIREALEKDPEIVALGLGVLFGYKP